MNKVGYVIYKLFDIYSIYTVKELAQKINVEQSSILKWKQKDSIGPLKKRCIELGIFSKIHKGLQRFEQENSTFENIDIEIIELLAELNGKANAIKNTAATRLEKQKVAKTFHNLMGNLKHLQS